MLWVLVCLLSQTLVGGSLDDDVNNTIGCSPACLRCGTKGCVKCPMLILHPSRKCVSSCPFGHRERWSTLSDYMGRICVGAPRAFGMGADAAAILAGIVCGLGLCSALIVLVIVYVRHKRKIAEMAPPSSVETSSDIDDTPERRDFLKQLETLRPYAEMYLGMLNDTRRQLRESYREGDSGAMAAYRPVLRDLAKVLLLLNRPLERIAIPDDWEHLFGWAEKALRRYKRMSDVSQPQVAQLISFLQGPVMVAGERGGTVMSTFKPDQGGTDDGSAKVAALNPQWKFEYSLVGGAAPSAEFDAAVWRNSREGLNSSLFLDDDFCQLGLRPQDEITTEL